MNATALVNRNTARIARGLKAAEAAASRGAGVACLGFPLVFMAGTTALETAQPGYNRVSNTISELVWGQSGWIENVLFIAFAAVLGLLTLKLRVAFVPLALAALGFIIIAIFPTQAPGARQTLESLIHQYSAQGIAMALPLACFCLARKWQAIAEHRFIVTCSLAAGVIGAGLNFAGFLAVYGDTDWIGAIERLVMLNGLIWLQLLSIHLWLSRRPVFAADRAARDHRPALLAAFFGRPSHQPARVPVTTRRDCC